MRGEDPDPVPVTGQNYFIIFGWVDFNVKNNQFYNNVQNMFPYYYKNLLITCIQMIRAVKLY